MKIENEITHFRCGACRVILPIGDLINRPWVGWDKSGAVQANNWCCPDCGSNDIIYRAPGADH